MSIDSNYPFGINDVPDRILGSKSVSRKYTGQIQRTPGGHQAAVIDERTGSLQPVGERFGRIPYTKKQSHLDPAFDADFVHEQFLGFVESGATINPIEFRVPDGYTLFIEKYLFKPFDSDYETWQIIPTQDGSPIRGLTSSDNNVHLPTLPQDQRNTRVEIEQSHTAGVRLVNGVAARRRVAVGFMGWMERIRREDRISRV